MSKISELSDGGVIQGGDTLIAVRSGGNVKVTYGGSTTANIDGGTIDGTVIGGSTPAALSATTGSFSSTLGVTAAATFASTLKTGGGAASNTSKLMVNTVSGTAAGIQLFQDGVESWIIQNPASTTALTFANSGSERLRITATGNVGIGNSNPSNYNAVGSNRLVVGTNVGNNGITIVGATTGFSSLAFADSAGSGGNDDYAGLIQYSHITNNMNFFTNSTQKMVLDSSGNVGIGTATPAAPLSFGSITNDARIYLRGNTNEFAIGTNGLQTVYAGYQGHVFQTGSFGGAERMRIDASGNLILGGTTAITDTGTPSLTLGNGAGNPSLNFYGTSAGQAGQISFGDATSATGAYEGYLLYDNANNFMAFGTNHTERARLDSAGHLIVPNGITLGTAVGTYNAANTLDDYEEGTWTPALTFETAGDLSVVYAAERIGTYRKIGDLVIAQFSVQCTTFTHTTASGNLQMTGLPFASVRSSSDFSGVGLNSFQGITKANYTQIGATTLNGGSYIFFSICGSGQAGENVTAADTPSGTLKLLRGTVIYRA
jgi:hypothetical protein